MILSLLVLLNFLLLSFFPIKAAFISLSSILICDLMGLEKLTNGFGLMTMFRGGAAMAGPPLAGKFIQITHSKRGTDNVLLKRSDTTWLPYIKQKKIAVHMIFFNFYLLTIFPRLLAFFVWFSLKYASKC